MSKCCGFDEIPSITHCDECGEKLVQDDKVCIIDGKHYCMECIEYYTTTVYE